MMDYTSVVLEVSYHFKRLHESDSTNHYWRYEVKIKKVKYGERIKHSKREMDERITLEKIHQLNNQFNLTLIGLLLVVDV